MMHTPKKSSKFESGYKLGETPQIDGEPEMESGKATFLFIKKKLE